MDRFSFFKRSTHRIFQLYDQYLENPTALSQVGGVFQGFDFGMTTYNEETQSSK
jgi:2-oxoglutarate dehydrogenase E1 component